MRPAHFIHISKTGGTAIKWALKAFVSVGTYDVRLHKHHAVLTDFPPGEPVFFMIRDPFDRFVSGFYSRRRQGRPRFDVPWSPAEAKAFAAFNTADELATALSASDPALRALARRSMHSIGHVRGSYWHWFGDPELFSMRASDVLAIVWLPHLTASFPRLCERLGLGPGVRLPTGDVDAHRNPPDLDRRLSDEARTNLRRWYWAEFEFVRVCRQHPAFISEQS
jgi:hypothetical protein